jgi:hypothetical protein
VEVITLKNSYAGAIAGFIAGIVCLIFYYIGGMIGLYSVGAENIKLAIIRFVATRILGVPLTATLAVIIIIVTIIFGVIFGVLYSKLYDSISGQDIKKGLHFGFMIWLIQGLAGGIYVAIMGGVTFATELIFIGFFMWIVYGAIIGKLYTK